MTRMDGLFAERSGLAHEAVLAALGRSGPLSRADLAREIGISPATVTQVVRRLLAQGMIEELSHEPSTGGRPPQLLGVVAGAGCAVGVKVAADHLALVKSRLDGSISDTQTIGFDAVGTEAPARLADALRPILRRPGTEPLLGLGVCVPGIVDTPHSGRVDSPVLDWNGLELGRQLREAFDLPVLVENDVKALAVAEQLFGRGRHHRNFVVLTIGRGIGAAVVADGEVVRGAHGSAGEIGHLSVGNASEKCLCGRTGCVEALISERALLHKAAQAGVIDPRSGIRHLYEQARLQKPAALDLFTDAGRLLARTVGGLIASVDPELVIILGEGVAGWFYWHKAFTAELSSMLPPPMSAVPVEVEDWEDDRWAQGAAALVLAIPFLGATAGPQTAEVLARLGAVG